MEFSYEHLTFFLRQHRTKIAVRLRRQIFRQIVQSECSKADALHGLTFGQLSNFVQYDGKDASKRTAKPVGRSLCGVALNYPHTLIIA